MIPRSTFILSGKALDFKIAKRFHNITCYHGHYLSKLLRQRSCTKWKKVKTIWDCVSSFHQTRNIETQNFSHIVKSPYKHLELPNITLLEFLSEKIEKFSKHVAIVSTLLCLKFAILVYLISLSVSVALDNKI